MTGTSDLTYVWGVKNDTGLVTFSNDPYIPNITTATFSSAGTYYIQVTIYNDLDLSVTRDVMVTVNQTASHIFFTSDHAPIHAGEHQQYTVEVDDNSVILSQDRQLVGRLIPTARLQ